MKVWWWRSNFRMSSYSCRRMCCRTTFMIVLISKRVDLYKITWWGIRGQQEAWRLRIFVINLADRWVNYQHCVKHCSNIMGSWWTYSLFIFALAVDVKLKVIWKKTYFELEKSFVLFGSLVLGLLRWSVGILSAKTTNEDSSCGNSKMSSCHGPQITL